MFFHNQIVSRATLVNKYLKETAIKAKIFKNIDIFNGISSTLTYYILQRFFSLFAPTLKGAN